MALLRSAASLLQFSTLNLLFSILFATAVSAQVPSTNPVVTEPWRPTADSKPGFGVLISPGVAPCVVHVNGLRFPLEKGTPITAKYEWDFGDPHGRYNHLPGFNAAHFYNQPGSYTISLKVTDEAGEARSASAHIVISADRRHTIYVSPGGSDLNIGTMPEAPLHSLRKAFKICPEGTEILLKAGGIYDADDWLNVMHSDVLVSRYEEGPDPVIMLLKQTGSAKPPHGSIGIDSRCNGVTFEHLTFDSPYGVDENAEAPKIGLEAIIARGRNITVRDCTFLNVDNGVNANGNPTGLLVEGCRAPLKTGLRAYLVWAQGTDFVCLGNYACNSTREHIVRIFGEQRVLAMDNDFTNLDRRPADKYDVSKGCIEMQRGAYAYIAHNTVTDGTIRVGPLGLYEDPSTATDWAVVENNKLTGTSIVAYPGAHHIAIRDNVIENDGAAAIQLQGPDKYGRANGDFHILHNLAINNATGGSFLRIWGRVDGIELKDNVFIAPQLKMGPNGSAAVNTVQTDLSSFTIISHNTWPAAAEGACIVNNHTLGHDEWESQPQVKEDHFAEAKVDPQRISAAGKLHLSPETVSGNK
jgi:PKD repeat protein